MSQPRCVFSRAKKPATLPATCWTATAECTCSECFSHSLQHVGPVSIDDGSQGTPTRCHAFADKTLGDADERNSASGRDVTCGGIVADEQLRSSDFGGEGCEG